MLNCSYSYILLLIMNVMIHDKIRFVIRKMGLPIHNLYPNSTTLDD